MIDKKNIKDEFRNRYITACNYIIEHNSIASEAAFAKSIGLHPQVFSDIKGGKLYPGIDNISVLLTKYFAINAMWLITGKGEMILPDSTTNTQVDINKVIELSTQLGKQINENKHLYEDNMKLRAEIDRLNKEVREKSPVYKLPNVAEP